MAADGWLSTASYAHIGKLAEDASPLNDTSNSSYLTLYRVRVQTNAAHVLVHHGLWDWCSSNPATR